MKAIVVLCAVAAVAVAGKPAQASGGVREKRGFLGGNVESSGWSGGYGGGVRDVYDGGYGGGFGGGYVSAPTATVVSVNKVISVPKVVEVPQVVNVRKVVSVPQFVTVKKIVPTYSGGYGTAGWW